MTAGLPPLPPLPLADAGQWIGLALLLGGVLVTILGKVFGGDRKTPIIGQGETVPEERPDEGAGEAAAMPQLDPRQRRQARSQLLERRRTLEEAAARFEATGQRVPAQLHAEVDFIDDALAELDRQDAADRPKPQPRPQPAQPVVPLVAANAVSTTAIGTGDASPAVPRDNGKARRLRRLLRTPGSARSIVAAAEVLSPPVSLRR